MPVIKWHEAEPCSFVLFHHIPKCAGSAFSKALAHYYGERYEWFHGPDGALAAMLSDLNNGHAAVGGHFSITDPKFHRLCECRDFILTTTFREPVERVISNYYYLLNTRKHFLHSVARKHTLSEVFKKGLGHKLQLSNEVTKMLGGTGEDDDCLQRAKDAVDRYTIFGLQEQMPTLARLFQELLGVGFVVTRAPAPYHRPRIEDIDSHTIGLIKEYNQQDIALHRHVKAVYDYKLMHDWRTHE